MLYSQLNPENERFHDRMIPILSHPVNLQTVIQWLEARIEMVQLRNGALLNQKQDEGVSIVR